MHRVFIRLAGHIDEAWAEWLDGFALTHTVECETILTGEVRDQAALYGLLAKLRDLGVHLRTISYQEIVPEGASK